jgi:hypothetical protein
MRIPSEGLVAQLDVIFLRSRKKFEESSVISIYNLNCTSSETGTTLRSTVDFREDFTHSQLSVDLLLRIESKPTDKTELTERGKQE